MEQTSKKITTICIPFRDDFVALAPKLEGFGASNLMPYGGKKSEQDESPEACALREFQEESGATALLKDLEKVAVIDFYEGERHLWECHCYFVRDWRGTLGAPEKMGPPEYFLWNAIPYERMFKGDAEWFPIVLAGRKIRRGMVRYASGFREVSESSFEEE